MLLARRAYKDVDIESRTVGFAVRLDGRPLRTPDGANVEVPTAALAEAVAAEWRNQQERIQPTTMPLTRLALTACGRMASQREGAVRALLAYLDTDLVCYRAEGPADLVARQSIAWQPLIHWFSACFQTPLTVTCGIVPISQPPALLSALDGHLATLNDFEMAALGVAVPATGSLVIGLALLEGRLDAEAAFAAAFIDETYQVERWGRDDEAEQRFQVVRADLEEVETFLALLREVTP